MKKALQFLLSIVAAALLSLNFSGSADSKGNFGIKEINLCYVSSPISGILPRAQGKVLENAGFQLAMEQFRSRTGKKATLLKYQAKGTDFVIPEGIKWASESGCIAVVGLVSSKDAMTAAHFLKEYGLSGFSSTATTNGLDKYFPYVLSASTSANKAIVEIINFAKADTRPLFIVVNERDFFSNTYYLKFKNDFPNANFLKLDNNGLISKEKLDELNIKKNGIIIFFITYPF